MEISFTKPFKKAYFKLSAKDRLRVDRALVLFIEDRATPALRNHALEGKLQGQFSFSASWDLRITCREEGDFVVVFLMNVETHNQAY
jgi:mRNA-degrading endonuclease YafQ of YafQ-DinJ toxin-antitoxin module